MNESNPSLRHSLMIRTAGALTLIALVVLAGMGGALLVAETTRGNASAVNVAGSLRMQSYRLLALAHDANQGSVQIDNWLAFVQSMEVFEQTLQRAALTNPDATGVDSRSTALYQGVVNKWATQIKPALLRMQQSDDAGQRSQELRGLMPMVQAYVNDIDVWVKQIERDTESRIAFLRLTIGLTLLLSLAVMLLTIFWQHRTLLKPLRVLVGFTAHIRQGNLQVRTPYTGQDEIGRLGQAFNLMAQDLSRFYDELEARVAEKTQDLERSNRCLELMYHSISRLYGGRIDADTFSLLLREIQEVLELGPGSVCLMDDTAQGGVSILSTTLKPEQGEIAFCSLSTCEACVEGEGLRTRYMGGHKVFSIVLRDAERVHGVLQIMADGDKDIEPWKSRLLEALARHIGTAIGTVRRVEHQRVLSLMEERSVIARELHDSLAQSLSYMKIQVSRLANVLSQRGSPASADSILDELREGLNSAYRQLRELLTTFRLRIEEDSLPIVLEKTAQEFAQRGSLEIRLEAQMTNCNLSANEEIHVLQIVREALSNVLHHAQAKHAFISINCEADGTIVLEIRDDGIGIGEKKVAVHHYGMTIMEERARSLGGTLHASNQPQGGMMLEVRFVPVALRNLDSAKTS